MNALAFFFVILSAQAGSTPSDVDLAKKIAAALAPEKCDSVRGDPIAKAREEIAAFRKSLKKDAELDRVLNAWLKIERDEGRDVSALNWIRAVEPILLPDDFPSRPAFLGCAAELGTFSNARKAAKPDAEIAADSAKDWAKCVRIAYAKERPPEFTALAKCLGAKDLSPEAED